MPPEGFRCGVNQTHQPPPAGIALRLLAGCAAVDACWQTVAPGWEAPHLPRGRRRRGRPAHWPPSQLMTIRIWFYGSPSPTLTASSTDTASSTAHVQTRLRGACPPRVRAPRRVERRPPVAVPRLAAVHQPRGACPGIRCLESPRWRAAIRRASATRGSSPPPPSGARPRAAGARGARCPGSSRSRSAGRG
jgi:hypothetical protein